MRSLSAHQNRIWYGHEIGRRVRSTTIVRVSRVRPIGSVTDDGKGGIGPSMRPFVAGMVADSADVVTDSRRASRVLSLFNSA